MEFEPVIDFLARTGKLIITAHETPDGDAIGSEIAMLHAMRRIGKTVRVMNADPTPRKFRFLGTDKDIEVLGSEEQLPKDIAEYALLLLDVNDIHNIGQVSTMILPRVREHFIIDHHENDDDIQSGNFIQKSSSSTAEILFQLFGALAIDLDFPTAQALFTGIVYDTGSFIYPKTTALTFAIARDLVERGVQPNRIYSHIYESNSISALVLQAKVLATLELALDDHVAIITMDKKLLEDSKASYEESDQFINIPLRSEEVRVSIFFKQNLEGLIRCSMRSKGDINVAEIAQIFGGGGHKTAAGFKCRDSVAKTKEILLQKLKVCFS